MFKKSKKKTPKSKIPIDTLIGQQTHIKGNVEFSGGLRVDGKVTGNINAVNDIDSVLSLSEQGTIAGEIRVPNMIINGAINGDVYAVGQIELADKATINGNVFYRLIEIAAGAEVNGQLIRMSAETDTPSSLEHAADAATQKLQIEQNTNS